MEDSRVGWSQLGTGARLFRIAHAVWGAFNLAGLGLPGLVGGNPAARWDRFRFGCGSWREGVALVVGRGDCPFGPFQASLGDPVPMFEWVLPPRAAKAAVPLLSLVSAVVLGAFVVRSLRSSSVS
jgi:hypothetical protein